MKFSSIVRKDVKLLFRSKGTALLLVLGPLLVMFLVGLAFDNSNAYRINVGVYAPNPTNLTNTFVSKLNHPFHVVKYSSLDSCVDDTKQGKINTCLAFPEDFSLKSENPQVTFYVDYSKLNLVWIVKDVVFSRLSEGSSEITEDLTNTLLQKLNDIETIVTNKRPLTTQLSTYVSFINQYSDDISTKVSSIDTSHPTINLMPLSASISSMKDKSNDNLDKAITYLSDARDTLNKEGNHTSLVKILSDQINDLKSLKSSLDMFYSQSNSKAEINQELANISYKLNIINSRFNNISTSLSSLNGDIQGIKHNVQLSFANIVDIQGVFDKIKQEIDSISVRQASKIVHPVSISIKPLSQHKTHLSLIFPTILVIIVMFAGLMIGSTVVVINKSSKASFRNLLSPVVPSVFTVSSFVTSLVLLVPQIILMLFVAFLFLKSDISHSLINSFIALLLMLSLFSSFGMLIAYLMRREESTILTVLTVSTLLLFLSNVFLPIEALPVWIVKFVYFNPFVLSQLVMNKILVFNFSLAQLSKPLLILLLYFVVFFAMCLLFNRTSLNKPRKTRLIKSQKIQLKKKKDKNDIHS